MKGTKEYTGYKTHTDMWEFHQRVNEYAYLRLKAEQAKAELAVKQYLANREAGLC